MNMDFVRAAFLDRARLGGARDQGWGASPEPDSPQTADHGEEAIVRRYAAVAAVLRQGARGAEVLLIRRALDERDPWSGHMALPGGHREDGDTDVVHTATRETIEEVRLDLGAHGQLLGRLDVVRAYSAARALDVVIAPLVFALTEPVSPSPNPSEVQEVVWASLAELSSGARRTTFSYRSDRARYEMPAFDVDGRIVWGLTYRILSALLSILSPDSPGGPTRTAPPEDR